MTQQVTKQLTKQIRDGLAMEQSVLRMLDSMLKTTNDSEMEKALEAHKLTTRQHVERLQQRLRAHGAYPSVLKQAGGAVGARMKAMVDVTRRERPARNARDGYATEQLEVAAYELLERVAQRAGDQETAKVASQNRAEDAAMAGLIARNWDSFAQQSVSSDGGEDAGKAGALKKGVKSAAGLAQNPIVISIGTVAAGLLLGRRGQSGGGGETQASKQQGREPLQQLSKQELQTRATHAGIQVSRNMTKQELIDALHSRKISSGGGGRANPIEVQGFLEGVNYPADKTELVREAERQGANEQVRGTIARLSQKRFQSPAEVSKAIGDLG